MAEKKQALLLFCKPPVPGLVKTRLTIERGGFLSPEQAAELFRRCLYDVSEMCMQALLSMQADNDALVAEDPSVDKITYDFFVSTTPADNVELMRETYDSLGKWPMEIHYITDKGATFDDHFDDAFKQIFDMGYEHIVSVGGDVPTMPITHISQAFQWLDYFQDLGTPGFVQAPCQECGTSLVGFSYNTPINHQGVYSTSPVSPRSTRTWKSSRRWISPRRTSRPSPTSTRRSTSRTPCPASAQSRRLRSTRPRSTCRSACSIGATS